MASSLDIVFHLLIPLLLLKFFNVKSKYVYFLLPLAVFFDLDRFLGVQKQLNSIVVVAIILFSLYLIFKRSGDRNLILGIASFYMLSHLALDLIWYQAFFWPIVSTFYLISSSITIQNYLPVFDLSVKAVETLPLAEPGFMGVLVSVEGFALLGLLVLLILIKIIRRR